MDDDKTKKGLGRGLMSLFSDQPEDSSTKLNINSPYLLVSISDLNRNRFQPRSYFNEQKIEELAQSIKKMVLFNQLQLDQDQMESMKL